MGDGWHKVCVLRSEDHVSSVGENGRGGRGKTGRQEKRREGKKWAEAGVGVSVAGERMSCGDAQGEERMIRRGEESNSRDIEREENGGCACLTQHVGACLLLIESPPQMHFF